METDEEDGMLKICNHPGCKEPTAHYPKAVCVKHAPKAVFAPSKGELEVARIAGDNWLDNPRIRIVTPVILNSTKFYTDLRELANHYCKFTTGPYIEGDALIKLDHRKYGDRKTSLQYWMDKEGKPLFKTGNTLTLSHFLTLSHTQSLSLVLVLALVQTALPMLPSQASPRTRPRKPKSKPKSR